MEIKNGINNMAFVKSRREKFFCWVRCERILGGWVIGLLRYSYEINLILSKEKSFLINKIRLISNISASLVLYKYQPGEFFKIKDR